MVTITSPPCLCKRHAIFSVSSPSWFQSPYVESVYHANWSVRSYIQGWMGYYSLYSFLTSITMKLSMLNKTLLVLKIPIAMTDKRQRWNRDCFLQLHISEKHQQSQVFIYINRCKRWSFSCKTENSWSKIPQRSKRCSLELVSCPSKRMGMMAIQQMI